MLLAFLSLMFEYARICPDNFTPVRKVAFLTSVLDVPYEADVRDAHVTPGNVAILTCVLPSYVTDYVTVTSWTRDVTFTNFTSLRPGQLTLKYISHYFMTSVDRA